MTRRLTVCQAIEEENVKVPGGDLRQHVLLVKNKSVQSLRPEEARQKRADLLLRAELWPPPHRCLSQVTVVQQVQRHGGVGHQPPEQPGGVTVSLEAQLALDLSPGAGRDLPLLGIGWNYTESRQIELAAGEHDEIQRKKPSRDLLLRICRSNSG